MKEEEEEIKRERGGGLTEELRGVSVARGFFIVGQTLVDDLAHSRIQTLQLLVLGRHR